MKQKYRPSNRLLKYLVCPLSSGPLEYDELHQELVSPRAKVAYPIKHGIPLLLSDHARPLD